MFKVYVGCTIAVLLVLPTTANSQMNNVVYPCVFGFVEDMKGNAVRDARVTLSAPFLPGVRTAYSNLDGLFCISGLPPGGSYRIFAEAANLRLPARLELTIRQGFKVPLVLTLTDSDNPYYAPDPRDLIRSETVISDCTCRSDLQAILDADKTRRDHNINNRK